MLIRSTFPKGVVMANMKNSKEEIYQELKELKQQYDELEKISLFENKINEILDRWGDLDERKIVEGKLMEIIPKHGLM